MHESIDQMWRTVRSYYEKSYRDPRNPNKGFRFRQRPTDEKIEELHAAMLLHQEQLKDYYTSKPGRYEKFLEWEEKKKGIVRDDKTRPV